MNPEYLVLAGWLWRLLKKRSVLWYTHKSVNLRLRLAVYFADAVCTASAESFRLPSEKVYVVGHGIDTVAFVPERRARRGKMLHVLTIGRLSPTKRIAEMLAALDELAARKVSFSFTIAGVPATLVDEHYEKSIRDALIKKSYAKQVRFLGAVSHKEIPKLLATHDVFVNLSLTGSIDKAVLEALTSGVPVVTTNEAFRSLLAPVGLYVEGGTPQTIADALMRAAKLDIRALAAEVREHYALPHAIAKVFGILDL